jgi:L-2-hydroxyglutarate oxidase LhgO
MDQVETIIIGAGVVGLAVARALACASHETLILEAESAIGSVTTARNSGVIHAGIYYPTGSLKAEHCLRGREMLYAYLRSRNLPFAQCGKVIVATDTTQLEKLQLIQKRAQACCVTNLQNLTAAEVRALEPELVGIAGLYSPSTGIVDVHELIHAFLSEAEAAGAMLALRSPIKSIQLSPQGGFVITTGGDAEHQLHCRHLVNTAGLGAQKVSNLFFELPKDTVPPLYLAKGNYFSLQGPSPFRHLVYPVPVDGGLGVHATLDLAGRVRFGPDVEWLEQKNNVPSIAFDYDVDPKRAEAFYAAIRLYWPALADGALQPDYSGIRPKNAPKGQESDFVIHDWRTHGIKGYLAFYGIESPGLTSALSLAETAEALLR